MLSWMSRSFLRLLKRAFRLLVELLGRFKISCMTFFASTWSFIKKSMASIATPKHTSAHARLPPLGERGSCQYMGVDGGLFGGRGGRARPAPTLWQTFIRGWSLRTS